jgi:hypothetical protein
MASGTLFVSFWNICLENLPEGSFLRRSITPEDARHLIESARKEKRLLCVSEDDLLAPYRKRERANHDALRRALVKHVGITLAFRDFTGSHETDAGSSYSTTPLVGVQIRGRDRLLVVTCRYTLGKRNKRNPLPFAIAPETIEFHLIESQGKKTATRKTRKR